MSTDAQPVPHRAHRLHRWLVWVPVGLVVVAGIGVGIDRAFLSEQARYSWPPEPCVVEGVDARCGTFVVPENRTKPNGRTIGLHVVVLPAFSKPARKDAVTYLAHRERWPSRPWYGPADLDLGSVGQWERWHDDRPFATACVEAPSRAAVDQVRHHFVDAVTRRTGQCG